MANDLSVVFQLIPDQLQPGRADTGVAHAKFGLNKFDELDEVRHGVHPKQRQEPPIQLKRFLTLPVHAKVEQIDRLPRQRVREAIFG